jgi:hypothetical protein
VANEPPRFEAAQGLTTLCSNGSIIEAFKGRDGTFLFLFTTPGAQGKTALRLSAPAMASFLDLARRLTDGK